MSKKKSLCLQQKRKDDEFYTPLDIIEKELCHYAAQFENKTIYCNCDDYTKSNFVKYFLDNFKALKLKRVIATCYRPNRLLFDDDYQKAVCLDYNGYDKKIKTLKRNGDFRSEECVEYLRQADIVVTNPPLSLFREFIKQLTYYKKGFIVIGNLNAFTYKICFNLFFNKKMWLGASGSQKVFYVRNNNTLKIINSSCWFTNIKHGVKPEELVLTKKYSEQDYQRFDNYDAINVDSVRDIPCDYYGVMGVPINFLFDYSPKQFEIIGTATRWFGLSNKTYPKQIIVKKDKRRNRNGLNEGPVIKINKPPSDGSTYYIVGDNFYVAKYARILIKRKPQRED